MRKIILLFVMTLLLLPLVMTGCGVAKAEYEAVVADRDAAKAQVASLQTVKSDVTSLVTTLEKKLAASAVIEGYLSDSFKYNAGTMSQSDFNMATATFMIGLGGALDAVGNAELSQLWKDAVAAAGRNDTKGFSAKMAAVMDSLTDLIKKDTAAIDAKLR